MIWPLLVASSPAIILSAVVFPQPDGPSKTKNSPGFTFIEKSFSYMRKSKAIHENWTLKKKISNKQIIKNFIKLIIPEFIIKIKRNHDAKTHLDDEKFVSGSEDSWCLRVLYKDLEN